MIKKTIILLFVAITTFVFSAFLAWIFFGEPNEFNKFGVKLQQSNKLLKHIKKTHQLPNPSCTEAKCLISWKEIEKEITILERKNKKLVRFSKFITWLTKGKKKKTSINY